MGGNCVREGVTEAVGVRLDVRLNVATLEGERELAEEEDALEEVELPKGGGKGPDRAVGKECHYCKKTGHLKADCRKLKADTEQARSTRRESSWCHLQDRRPASGDSSATQRPAQHCRCR